MNEPQVEANAREIIERARRERSKELDLSANALAGCLEEIPDEIFALVHLENLDLAGNAIREVSEKIRNLPNLRRLCLARNPIYKVPDIPGLALDWAGYLRSRKKLSTENVQEVWILDEEKGSSFPEGSGGPAGGIVGDSGRGSRDLPGRGWLGLRLTQGIGLRPHPWAVISRPVGPVGVWRTAPSLSGTPLSGGQPFIAPGLDPGRVGSRCRRSRSQQVAEGLSPAPDTPVGLIALSRWHERCLGCGGGGKGPETAHGNVYMRSSWHGECRFGKLRLEPFDRVKCLNGGQYCPPTGHKVPWDRHPRRTEAPVSGGSRGFRGGPIRWHRLCVSSLSEERNTG